MSKIYEVLDNKLGEESATTFLRKANILMAKWDSTGEITEKVQFQKELVQLFNEYELTQAEQEQYINEINSIMKENLVLWETTR